MVAISVMGVAKVGLFVESNSGTLDSKKPGQPEAMTLVALFSKGCLYTLFKCAEFRLLSISCSMCRFYLLPSLILNR